MTETSTQDLSPTDTAAAIAAIRGELGERLAILSHHYMRDEVVRHSDLRGDSLELARRIDGLRAEYIVFCGVFFMAETAAILREPHQKVYIPSHKASCTMADQAPAGLVRIALERLSASGRKIVPLTYVNSSAEVKAVVGAAGGSVCTSANARTMLDWAMSQGDAVLFLPDRNLAMNTARDIGVAESRQHILDIRKAGSLIDLDAAGKADLLIWPGSCCIHHKFKAEDVADIRANDPGSLVVVHPECRPEVVLAADSAGSTRHIIQYVEDAPEGSTVYVGTETSLVLRLKKQFEGRRTVLPLGMSFCGGMGRITEAGLLRTLQHLDTEPVVEVPETVARDAKIALERMLVACS